jgi:hypothetical protein
MVGFGRVAGLLLFHEFGNGRPVSWLDSQYKSTWLLLAITISPAQDHSTVASIDPSS